MPSRIAIDPVTRIEGHLRVELEVADDGVVTSAYVAGTMARGLETVLVGRDPRGAWALAQRACGVCTFVHGLASVRAVEDAVGAHVPPAAQAIRNLMLAQQFVHDHVMHFYHLHALDWVNPASAAGADPAEAAALQARISPWPSTTQEYLAGVKDRLRAILSSDRPSLLAVGPWDHPGYSLPASLDLLAMAHYFQALDWQAAATTIHTVFGGRNPHPNLVVGGVACPIDMDSETAINRRRLDQVRQSMYALVTFVDQVYWPDLLAILAHYKDYAALGESLGNFLCWGEFTDLATSPLTFPAAAILGRDPDHAVMPEPTDEARLLEYVDRSYYEYRGGGGVGLHPWRGETRLAYSGPPLPYDQLDVEGAYSWLKAPRWDSHAMEVGPLARVLALLGAGHQAARDMVDEALTALELPAEALYSTLGRTLARAVETRLLAGAMSGMLDSLESLIESGEARTFDDTVWDPATWPRRSRGVGLVEAPRGALGHWVVIENDRVASYQMVVPTTWNASPRDAAGLPGPYEAALAGLALNRRLQPLEALRVIHSFDPCLACAVH
jgi:hydrogenase large subunit